MQNGMERPGSKYKHLLINYQNYLYTNTHRVMHTYTHTHTHSHTLTHTLTFPCICFCVCSCMCVYATNSKVIFVSAVLYINVFVSFVYMCHLSLCIACVCPLVCVCLCLCGVFGY